MSNTVIKVENVSKLYRLGEIGTGSISTDLNRWWAKIRGKEDPYAKVGETNDRTSKGNSEFVWALKDIDFEIHQGDVVGIIGRNGAGKSTLLKILSKTTAPTTGSIKVKGRIASLLEVGTGFHPDLSGRENIFLNGAILGMTRKEIARKFDEIVDFAGVERYIDTPVKRYSSGMYVRLAFAVAAHLEPEILIVDEVLAVGDAEFQKKCLGKMKDVSVNEGRTVLFVSHNLAAVTSLCDKCLFMKNGTKKDMGYTNKIIESYILDGKESEGEILGDAIIYEKKFHGASFNAIRTIRANGECSTSFGINEAVTVEIDYEVHVDNTKLYPSIHLLDHLGNCILATFNGASANTVVDPFFDIPLQKGYYKTRCTIPAFFLNDTTYMISCFLVPEGMNDMTVAKEALRFSITETGEMRQEYAGSWAGLIRPKLEWKSERINN